MLLDHFANTYGAVTSANNNGTWSNTTILTSIAIIVLIALILIRWAMKRANQTMEELRRNEELNNSNNNHNHTSY